MPARGWHHDPHVQHHPRDIRSNGGPAPMLIAKAQEMVRILGEVSDALESSASGLRYLAHGGTSAPTATQAETTTARRRGRTAGRLFGQILLRDGNVTSKSIKSAVTPGGAAR
jgi:hypothetical protein